MITNYITLFWQRAARIILFALSSLALYSCSSPEQTNPCHWKVSLIEDFPSGAIRQRYSPIANKLAYIAYGDVGMIDMASRAITDVNFGITSAGPHLNIGLGDSLVPWGIQAVDWSPYDKTLLVVVQLGAINDTIDPWRTGMLFLHSDGSLDTLFIGALSEHAQYLGWLNDSRPGSDSLVFGSIPDNISGLETGDTELTVFCPESGKFLPLSSNLISYTFRQSATGKHVFAFSGTLHSYSFDNKAVNWGNLKPYSIGSVSFSPDEKHIAIEDRGGAGGYEWIYNVSDFLSGEPVSPISELDFVKMYCFGSALGIWGEFVSDSSLVVSLNGDPATGAQINLYEVDFNGDIIRKLTSY